MAQQPTTSTVTITPRIVRAGDDQGIDRLSMLGFISGRQGPWNGPGPGDDGAWVRYRGHYVERWSSEDGRIVRVTYQNHLDEAATNMWPAALSSLDVLRDIDDLLDIVLDRWPLDDEGQQ